MAKAKGEYPTRLKIAKVIALYKKGEKYSPGNYRPISLLSCLNKMFEKLWCKRQISGSKQNIVWFSIWISKTTLHHIDIDWNYR